MRCRIVSARLCQSVSTCSSPFRSPFASLGNGTPYHAAEKPLILETSARQAPKIRCYSLIFGIGGGGLV